MATDNKPVTAYLPPHLEESLTEYCTEYEIMRKDKTGQIKPSLGTAVVEILKLFFSSEVIPAPICERLPGTLPSHVVTEEKLEKALAESAAKLTASLRAEFAPILEAQREGEELLRKFESVQGVNQELRERLEKLESSQEVELVETPTQIDKASLEPIFADFDSNSEPQLEPSEAKTEYFSAAEAYEIAKERGFKSSKNAFKQRFVAHPDGEVCGIRRDRTRMGKVLARSNPFFG